MSPPPPSPLQAQSRFGHYRALYSASTSPYAIDGRTLGGTAAPPAWARTTVDHGDNVADAGTAPHAHSHGGPPSPLPYPFGSAFGAHMFGVQGPPLASGPYSPHGSPANEPAGPARQAFMCDSYACPPRKRTPQACEPCKKRKARCDNAEGGRCGRCESKKIECVYAARPPRGIQRMREQMRSAEQDDMVRFNSGGGPGAQPRARSYEPPSVAFQANCLAMLAPRPLQSLPGQVYVAEDYGSQGSDTASSSDGSPSPAVPTSHFPQLSVSYGYPGYAYNVDDDEAQTLASSYLDRNIDPALYEEERRYAGISVDVASLTVGQEASPARPPTNGLSLDLNYGSGPETSYHMYRRLSTFPGSTGETSPSSASSGSGSSVAPSPLSLTFDSPASSTPTEIEDEPTPCMMNDYFGEYDDYYARLGAMRLSSSMENTSAPGTASIVLDYGCAPAEDSKAGLGGMSPSETVTNFNYLSNIAQP